MEEWLGRDCVDLKKYAAIDASKNEAGLIFSKPNRGGAATQACWVRNHPYGDRSRGHGLPCFGFVQEGVDAFAVPGAGLDAFEPKLGRCGPEHALSAETL